jgi:tRNA(fMet)-specific endonuclease VapC
VRSSRPSCGTARKKYGNRHRRQRALEMLFAPFASLPFDDAAARHYADIRHQLEVQGRSLGPNDLKIAATARTQGPFANSTTLRAFHISKKELALQMHTGRFR